MQTPSASASTHLQLRNAKNPPTVHYTGCLYPPWLGSFSSPIIPYRSRCPFSLLNWRWFLSDFRIEILVPGDGETASGREVCLACRDCRWCLLYPGRVFFFRTSHSSSRSWPITWLSASRISSFTGAEYLPGEILFGNSYRSPGMVGRKFRSEDELFEKPRILKSTGVVWNLCFCWGFGEGDIDRTMYLQ